MVPAFYSEILAVADNTVKGEPAEMNFKLLDDRETNQVYLTLKNYQQPLGVST
jgi:hypothetical protein